MLLKKLFQCQKGTVIPQYLILGLLIGGIALAATKAIMSQLATTHNSAINTIITITGGGF